MGKGAESDVTETPAEPEPLSPPSEPQVVPHVSPAIENASSVSVTPQLGEAVSETVLLQDRKMQSPPIASKPDQHTRSATCHCGGHC